MKEFVIKHKLAIGVAVIVTVVVVLAAIVAIAAGMRKGDSGSNLKDSQEASVTVCSKGGLVFSGISVYIYEDDSLAELVDVKRTDTNGKAVFKTEGKGKYVAVLEGIPKGYDVKDKYEITQVDTKITLDTVLVKSEDLSKEKFAPGDIMKDFTVTASDGTAYTLSELLAKKDAVVLNFWYLTCVPCKEEFPLLEQAYEEHKDRIEVLAMNPINSDASAIAEYVSQLGLKFPVAACDEAFSKAFGLLSYPTTVVIDKYGMISLIEEGSIDKKETFAAIFEYYSDSRYVQHTVTGLSEILKGNEPAESGTDVPGPSEDESGSSEDGPGASENQPGTSENKPGTSENVPGASENKPGSSENQPQTSESESGSSEQPSGTESNTGTGDGKITYSVTVKDYAGKALSGVEVRFGKDGTVQQTVKTDAGGKASAKLESDDYTVELSVDGKYDANTAKLSPSKTSAEIKVAQVAKKTQAIWEIPRYEVFEGGTYVPIEKLDGDDYCYVVFHPLRSGTYKVEVSDNGTKLSEHSSSILSLIAENLPGNVLTLNIKDSYLSDFTQYVFGLTGADDCILTVTRIGDAVLDPGDYPYTVYKGTHKPTQFTYKGKGELTYFDVSAASGLKPSDIVLGSDGFYHYGSATGPVIYLDFENLTLSLCHMVIGDGSTGGDGFRVYIYNSNGKYDRKEDYTDCLANYISCMDPEKHLYPLTEDLRYILETGGKANGWYDGPSKEMVFGSKIINIKTAWLFLCCYEK